MESKARFFSWLNLHGLIVIVLSKLLVHQLPFLPLGISPFWEPRSKPTRISGRWSSLSSLDASPKHRHRQAENAIVFQSLAHFSATICIGKRSPRNIKDQWMDRWLTVQISLKMAAGEPAHRLRGSEISWWRQMVRDWEIGHSTHHGQPTKSGLGGSGIFSWRWLTFSHHGSV